jgi:threonine/homoserine/homoserine lactone efflux protein
LIFGATFSDAARRNSVRRHVVTRPRVLTWMRRTFAAAFGALGARLAFTER